MVIYPCANFGKPISKQKSYGLDTNLQTNGWTDRKPDRVIPIYPLILVLGGIIMTNGIVQLLHYEYLGESQKCIYTKHSLLITNLHEQQAYKFVQFSD